MHPHEKLPNVIGHLIRAARIGNELSQDDVALALGVSVSAVSQWECGKTSPKGVNIIKLSGMLGINFPSAEEPAVAAASGANRHLPRLDELREYVEEISDLLHALDKVGDGIGGSDGYAVSAVALNAKSIASNALGLIVALSSHANAREEG